MAGVTKSLLILYAQTYLHPGAGSTTGVVDLPVQREVNTNFPYIAGSGLKGSLRDKAEELSGVGGRPAPSEAAAREAKPLSKVEIVFGPPAGASDEYASCIAVGDAKILAMPVRSLAHTFFWVTSPLALARFQRDCEMIGVEALRGWSIPSVDTGSAATPNECNVTCSFMLEELSVNLSRNPAVSKIAADIAELLSERVGQVFLSKFKKDFAILSDDDFTHLVRFGTQVTARIALNERKTTTDDGGNLWYEEYIPPETVFYSLLLTNNPRSSRGRGGSQLITTSVEAMDYIRKEVLGDGYLQVGGNETQGQGWCLTNLVPESKGV